MPSSGLSNWNWCTWTRRFSEPACDFKTGEGRSRLGLCVRYWRRWSLTCRSSKLSGADDIVSSAIPRRHHEVCDLGFCYNNKMPELCTRCCRVTSLPQARPCSNRFVDLFLCQRQPHSGNSQRNARPVDKENILWRTKVRFNRTASHSLCRTWRH